MRKILRALFTSFSRRRSLNGVMKQRKVLHSNVEAALLGLFSELRIKYQYWSSTAFNTMWPSSLGKNSPVWHIPNLEEAKGLMQALDPNNKEVELVPGETKFLTAPWTVH